MSILTYWSTSHSSDNRAAYARLPSRSSFNCTSFGSLMGSCGYRFGSRQVFSLERWSEFQASGKRESTLVMMDGFPIKHATSQTSMVREEMQGCKACQVNCHLQKSLSYFFAKTYFCNLFGQQCTKQHKLRKRLGQTIEELYHV